MKPRQINIPQAAVGMAMIVVGAAAILWEPPQTAAVGVLEIPSLTAWGKVFSFLLLTALGVAYLVWRGPIVRAQAILETSPLGAGAQSAALVDWHLYLKTILATDGAALACVVGLRMAGITLTTVDTMGLLASGAIVAFVIHLLLLSRRGDRHSRDHG